MESGHRRHEEERLEMVLAEIHRQIEGKRLEIENDIENQIKITKTQWEEELPTAIRGFEDLAVLAAENQRIALLNKYHDLSRGGLRRLERMASSPYFGRIDFRPSFSDTSIQIYIGVSALADEKSGAHLVFDWRAPVSSMFYDCELGPAKYDSLRGAIHGELLLKRQFKIENGRLLFMFDTDLTIDDDILQQVLSAAQGDHMRTIVNTIQKEQDQVIRNERHKILIVQGVAGSGKTSIALHRAAYLLYRYRGNMTSNSIVIFSPNRVFSDYISDVLPELGEANVSQATFKELAEDLLENRFNIEDVHDQLEYVIGGRDHGRVGKVYDATNLSGADERYRTRMASIQWKSSGDFVQTIKNYAGFLERQDPGFQPLVHNENVLVSKEELQTLFSRDYAYLPLYKRLDKIRRRVLWLLGPIEAQRRKQLAERMANDPDYAGYMENDIRVFARQKVSQEFSGLRAHINSLTSRNVVSEYIKLFKNQEMFKTVASGALPDAFPQIAGGTVKNLSAGFIPYEDLAPILLLKHMVEGYPEKSIAPHQKEAVAKSNPPVPYSQVKHVIIDEAQDYGLPQYEVFKRVFPNASMTILGDLNQSVHPRYAIGEYRELQATFSEEAPVLVTLQKSYRTTTEIAQYAKAILPKGEAFETVQRPGPLPIAARTKNVLHDVYTTIKSLESEGLQSVAVICKTAAESQLIHQKLQVLAGDNKVHLVRAKDSKFVKGVVVIPSYLAKGLEFEAVIVCDADNEHYYHEEDRKLLHMVCTRALHRLFLYYSGEISPFLSNIDPSLYSSA